MLDRRHRLRIILRLEFHLHEINASLISGAASRKPKRFAERLTLTPTSLCSVPFYTSTLVHRSPITVKATLSAVLRENRRLIAAGTLVITALLLVALLATLLIRSSTSFSRFSRLQFCSICGIAQSYREIGFVDRAVFTSTSLLENGISRILRQSKKECGHNFHTAHERMDHFSIQRTPIYIKREFGTDYGADVFSHPNFLAAIAAIHSNNAESARLIWHRTFRHFAEDRTNAIQLIRTVLNTQSPQQVETFLTTNPSFKPYRPNPERWFYSKF